MKLFKKHLRWFLERVDRDRLDSTAAHGAFFLLISFLPFVAFLLTLLQQIHFADGVTLIEAALGIFPVPVALTIVLGMQLSRFLVTLAGIAGVVAVMRYMS